MQKKIKPSILPGFMELGPKEQRIWNDMIAKMTSVYEQNGCMPMDTPVIEKEEILLAKSAGETEKQVYRIDKEKMKQALRFDLTVPFARYVAQHMNELVFPFKRYQLGKVYRGERNQKGRYREFYQLDIDIVNTGKLAITNDAFVISLAAQAFESIGLSNYQFHISNRKILTGVLMLLGVGAQQDVMGIVDKYEKIGKETCLKELEGLIGASASRLLGELLQLTGDATYILTALRQVAQELSGETTVETSQLDNGYAKMMEGIEELEIVSRTLEWLGVKRFRMDLKIIRGLDYYTGTIFETSIEGAEAYGSICSGGRYDDLASLYTDVKLPGVGISIGMTRLFFVLKEIGFLETYKVAEESTYLIMPLGDTLRTCVEVNQALVQQGKKSEIYWNPEPLKKQLRYAAARAVDIAIIIGEDEVREEALVIKYLQTGKQVRVNQSAWLESILCLQ